MLLCAIAEYLFPGGLLVEEHIANVGIPLDIFKFLSFHFFLWVFGSLQTSLLCIMGELAGEGSVALAVAVSDRLQVTSDTRHIKCDPGMTHDM